MTVRRIILDTFTDILASQWEELLALRDEFDDIEKIIRSMQSDAGHAAVSP